MSLHHCIMYLIELRLNNFECNIELSMLLFGITFTACSDKFLIKKNSINIFGLNFKYYFAYLPIFQ